MTHRTATALATLTLAALLISCGPDPQYATPEDAAQTYLENGPKLKNSIDIPAYNFCYFGLSQEAKTWFDDHWEDICDHVNYRGACGEHSENKAKIVAFAAVAERGPGRNNKVKDVMVDGDYAEVKFSNWGGTMYLVQEERGNWKIDELFGLEDADPKHY